MTWVKRGWVMWRWMLVLVWLCAAVGCEDDTRYSSGVGEPDAPNNEAPDADRPLEDVDGEIEDTPSPDPAPDAMVMTDVVDDAPDPECDCEDDFDCPGDAFCDACECVSLCGCASDDDCGDPAMICVDCDCFVAPEGQCRVLCEARESAQEEMGFCPVEFMEERPCERVCEALLVRASPETVTAVGFCLATDPLCFQSLDDCIFRTRYPDPVEVPISLEGSGFEAHEGRTVYAGLSVGNMLLPAPVATISGGAWRQQWRAEVFVESRLLLPFFIDVDGDGRCDPDVDLPASGNAIRSEDFDAPVYSAQVEGDVRRQDFICDSF